MDKRFMRAVLTAAALFIGFHSVLFSQNRINESDNFHNTAYIETAGDEIKNRLFRYGEAIKHKKYELATSHLLRALQLDSASVAPYGPRTYLSIRQIALRQIAAMPEAAKSIYLKAAENEAAPLLGKGEKTLNEDIFRKILSRYPLTPSAFKAYCMLGRMASERGAFLSAAREYSFFMDEAAFLPVEPEWLAFVKNARYMALSRAGRRQDAEATAPEGEMVIQGQRIPASRISELMGKQAPVSDTQISGWPVRGGHRSRAVHSSFDCDQLKYRWGYSIMDSSTQDFAGPFDPITLSFLKSKPLMASVYPIVYENGVYVFNEIALHPLNLETGKPLFGPIRWDWSFLFGEEPFRLDSVTYSGAIDKGVLYGVLNKKCRDAQTTTDHEGYLIALDLKKQGYALWRRGGSLDLNPFFKDVAFTGAPAIVEDRVFIMGTRYPSAGETKAEAHLFCFRASDGDLIFRNHICTGAEVTRFEIRIGGDNRRAKDYIELGAPVAEHDGIVYCLTNLGVAAAIDAFTGESLWLFKYNRIFPQDASEYYADFCLDTGGWKNSLPFVMDQKLYISPEDSRFFYCLDKQPSLEGYLILDDPIEKGAMINLIGARSGIFYFTAREAGIHYIAATDANGSVLWESMPFEKEDRICGRSLLTKTAIFTPTERYIYRIDLKKKGLITHMFELPQEKLGAKKKVSRFGNIIAIKQTLVSVSNEDVFVFTGLTN